MERWGYEIKGSWQLLGRCRWTRDVNVDSKFCKVLTEYPRGIPKCIQWSSPNETFHNFSSKLVFFDLAASPLALGRTDQNNVFVLKWRLQVAWPYAYDRVNTTKRRAIVVIIIRAMENRFEYLLFHFSKLLTVGRWCFGNFGPSWADSTISNSQWSCHGSGFAPNVYKC